MVSGGCVWVTAIYNGIRGSSVKGPSEEIAVSFDESLFMHYLLFLAGWISSERLHNRFLLSLSVVGLSSLADLGSACEIGVGVGVTDGLHAAPA